MKSCLYYAELLVYWITKEARVRGRTRTTTMVDQKLPLHNLQADLTLSWKRHATSAYGMT